MFFYVFSLECKPQGGQWVFFHVHWFTSITDPEKCLAHDKHLINISWLNHWRNFIVFTIIGKQKQTAGYDYHKPF